MDKGCSISNLVELQQKAGGDGSGGFGSQDNINDGGTGASGDERWCPAAGGAGPRVVAGGVRGGDGSSGVGVGDGGGSGGSCAQGGQGDGGSKRARLCRPGGAASRTPSRRQAHLRGVKLPATLPGVTLTGNEFLTRPNTLRGVTPLP